MRACWCTLGNTDACLRCPNNPYRERSAQEFLQDNYPGRVPMGYPSPMTPEEIERVARRVAELLKENKD